eukprot:TRINITY_DN2902_c0_g1_i3.p1 TRINITY_DN2902_c0_g1~~TRINITY_DN2902_c0_g1_i3.p1  ORF type:complete len:436 (-),score=55.41 TRINITY_DN2902_c0_g1_i3:29-1336(-)
MPRSIQVLSEPREFFEYLKLSISNAKKQIILSSLYIGIGAKSEQLVNAIKQALYEHPKLKVTILLDKQRASRSSNGKSSRSLLLQNLSIPFPDRVSIYLYQTPHLKWPLNHILPSQVNEILGVQHIKAYITDSNLLISGANLSEEYFTSRKDRYISFQEEKITQYYSDLVNTVSSFSFKLHSNDTVSLDDGVPNPSLRSRLFCEFANRQLNKLKEDYESRTSLSLNHDTWIAPSVQMGVANINDEHETTIALLKNCASDEKIYLTSPYFNFTENHTEAVLKAPNQSEILVAAPQANGFYQGGGLKKYIPMAYAQVFDDFFTLVKKQSQDKRLKLMLYCAEGGTYHAKGIWIIGKDSHGVNYTTTTIGSSNFGQRSKERDIESQITLITENPWINHMLKLEREFIWGPTLEYKGETHMFSSPKWLSWLIPILKKFL